MTLILPAKLYLSEEQSEALARTLDKLSDAVGTVSGDVNGDGRIEVLSYWRRAGIYIITWPKLQPKK